MLDFCNRIITIAILAQYKVFGLIHILCIKKSCTPFVEVAFDFCNVFLQRKTAVEIMCDNNNIKQIFCNMCKYQIRSTDLQLKYTKGIFKQTWDFMYLSS